MKDRAKEFVVVILITAFISLIGNWVGTKVSPIEALPGMILLVLICAVGFFLGEALPFKAPAVLYIVTLGAIVTFPAFPGSAYIAEQVGKVNFLALATPISISNTYKSYSVFSRAISKACPDWNESIRTEGSFTISRINACVWSNNFFSSSTIAILSTYETPP